MPLPAPLIFRPLVKRALWGGRRLGDVLGIPIGDERDYAESWEIVDRGTDQSVVAAGPFAGTSLGELRRVHGAELLGRHHPQSRFPLLFKFLDCRDKLSVQVHPNDAQAAQLSPPDLGKTEAWVILAAEPGSLIYAGLKRGFDRAAFEREVHRGTSDLCLHRFEPKPGDCLFLPAGVVHAPGAGVLMAEIQQSSDTTFRLFDWNRVGTDGKPRALHVEQGLNAINFDYGPANPQTPQPTDDPRVERLVDCDKFVLDRITLESGSWEVPPEMPQSATCRILAVIEGAVRLEGFDGSPLSLSKGRTALIPAACRGARLVADGRATVLSAHLP